MFKEIIFLRCMVSYGVGMHGCQDFPKFSTPKLHQFKFKITGPCDFADIAALKCFRRYQVMHSLYSKQLGFEWDFKLGGLDDI
jgi:hypothetical protein